MEGSGSVQISTDPDPGGPKTYGSESGSGNQQINLNFPERKAGLESEKIHSIALQTDVMTLS